MRIIESFFNESKPLKFSLNGKAFIMPNLNSLNYLELQEMIDEIQGNHFSRWLFKFTSYNIIKELSVSQNQMIISSIENHCGFKISELALIFSIMENHPEEFILDLASKGLNLNKFFKLKPFEAIYLIKGILKGVERSYISAAYKEYKYPFALEDWILSDIWRLLLQVNSKEPNNVPSDAYGRLPIRSNADNIRELEKYNDGQEAAEEKSPEEIEEFMQAVIDKLEGK